MGTISELTEDDLSLPQFAAAEGLSYFRAREMGLRGLVRLRWVGSRVYVSRQSVEKWKAAQQRSAAQAAKRAGSR